MVVPIVMDDAVVIGAWIDREIETVSYTWWKVPWFAFVETFKLISVIIAAIGGFFYQLFSTASVSTDFAISGHIKISPFEWDGDVAKIFPDQELHINAIVKNNTGLKMQGLELLKMS